MLTRTVHSCLTLKPRHGVEQGNSGTQEVAGKQISVTRRWVAGRWEDACDGRVAERGSVAKGRMGNCEVWEEDC